MGCFDSVTFRCPLCSHDIELQSKAGRCAQLAYDERDVPIVIAADLLEHKSTTRCSKCNADLVVRSNLRAWVSMRLVPAPIQREDDENDYDGYAVDRSKTIIGVGANKKDQNQ